MKIKFLNKLLVVSSIIFITACGNPVVKVNYKMQLAQAIVDNNEHIVNSLLSQVKISANAMNLISQYIDLRNNKHVTLMRKLTISNPMVLNESYSYNQIHRAINIWAFAEEVYRIEIAKTVRILQRKELFIAPRVVDFNKCKAFDSNKCAREARKQLYQFIGSKELSELLYKMAEKDPCINLTEELIGQQTADLCLQKRMGETQVNLIALPEFTVDDWYQAL